MRVRTLLLALAGTMFVSAVVAAASRLWLPAASLSLGALSMLGLYVVRGTGDEARVVDEVRSAPRFRTVSAALVLVVTIGSAIFFGVRNS